MTIDRADAWDRLVALDEDRPTRAPPAEPFSRVAERVRALPDPWLAVCDVHAAVITRAAAPGALSPEDVEALAEVAVCDGCRSLLRAHPDVDVADLEAPRPLPAVFRSIPTRGPVRWPWVAVAALAAAALVAALAWPAPPRDTRPGPTLLGATGYAWVSPSGPITWGRSGYAWVAPGDTATYRFVRHPPPPPDGAAEYRYQGPILLGFTGAGDTP